MGDGSGKLQCATQPAGNAGGWRGSFVCLLQEPLSSPYSLCLLGRRGPSESSQFQELPKVPKCLLPQLNELLCRTECFYLPVNIMYLSELSSKREGFNLYNTT